MLAERLPGLLPPLDREHALEVTAIHSLAGVLPSTKPLITMPPYCGPHHTASVAAMVGGGSSMIRPGAVSLAHRGVLFLDEAAEFRSGVLDALRQPLEMGRVVISRAQASAEYPARFLLLMATNPCPCGMAGSRDAHCECPPQRQRRYLARLSGPLLDRVDVRLRVERVSRAVLASASEAETTATVAVRVHDARDKAEKRLAGTPWRSNSEVPGRELRRAFRPSAGALAVLDRPIATGALTARGFDRVIRVAWSIADLSGRDAPGRDDVAEAFALRASSALTIAG
jgi:magnesium chelatase family protein